MIRNSNLQKIDELEQFLEEQEDISKPVSFGSLGPTDFSFDPAKTKVTDLGGGAGMLSDPEKLFISNPQEQLKIGIYNPLGLDTLVQETEEEFIIRIRKKYGGNTQG